MDSPFCDAAIPSDTGKGREIRREALNLPLDFDLKGTIGLISFCVRQIFDSPSSIVFDGQPHLIGRLEGALPRRRG